MKNFSIFLLTFTCSLLSIADETTRFSLEDTIGSTTAAESVSSNDATVNGTVTFQEDSALASINKSASFDGASYLEAPFNAVFNPVSFSVDAWVKPTIATGDRSIAVSMANNEGYMLRINNNGKLYLYLGNGTGTVNFGGSLAVPANEWSHVAATFKSLSVDGNGVHTGEVKLYLNGKIHGTGTKTYKPATTAPFRIGAGGNGNLNNKFTGSIDEVRVYSHVVSPLVEFDSYYNTTGYITRKTFTNLAGWDIKTLTSDADYPTNPDKAELLTGNGFKTPVNSADNFGAIVEAFYTPSSGSSFQFHLAGDDYAELWISNDKNLTSLNRIAWIDGWTSPGQWNKYPSQTSASVTLIPGQTYLLRGLYKEGSGGDHLEVQVTVDGGTQQSIPDAELSPVLFDVATNKTLLSESLTFANSQLTLAQANSGTGLGNYSPSAIANLQTDIAAAQAVNDDINSTGRQHYAANWDLTEKLKEFGALTATKLFGEIIGTEPSWNVGREFDKAHDGLITTYVDTLLKSGWTGIDLGTGEDAVVTTIRYYPRNGQAARMPDGTFEGSVDGVTWTVLHTITATPASDWNEIDLSTNTTAYRYYRYNDPNGWTNVAEIEFYAFHSPTLKQVLNKAQSLSFNTADQIIKADHLRAEHGGLYHNFITYSLTIKPVEGQLKLDGVPLEIDPNLGPTTFTQEDIDNGKLTYTSSPNNHNNDTFSFTVADTVGGTLAEAFFSIVIDTDLDGIDDTTELAGSTDWNDADSDDDGESDKWELDNGTDPNVNSLSPAVATLQGENGVSASFWYNASPSSLSLFQYNAGPNEVKKMNNIGFSNSFNGNAGGSSQKNYVVARYDSYLWIPVAGNYTFELISDDGSKLSLDGQELINNDGLHAPVSKTANKNFTTPGFKKLKLDYLQAGGYHTCILMWSGPGQPKQIIPAKYFFLSIPEHDETVASADSDGDLLSDGDELQALTDPNNPDSDDDGLLDGEEHHAVYGYQTNPLSEDTDNDSISDYEEIFLYKSNPLIPDFNGQIVLLRSLNPAAPFNTVGEWVIAGSTIRNSTQSGTVEYNFDVLENEGNLVLAVDLKQHIETSDHNTVRVQFFIDGQYVTQNAVTLSPTGNTELKTVIPVLKPGKHDLTIRLINLYRDSSMQITGIRLLNVMGAEAGENWKNHYLKNLCKLTTDVTKSKVSPLCLEGKGQYPEMMTISQGLSPIMIDHDKWYVDFPLIQNKINPVDVTWQHGARAESLQVEWEETNVITDADMTIRVNDSLLLNALTGEEDEGFPDVTLTISGTDYKISPLNPLSYKFDTAGDYQIDVTYTSATGNTTTGSMNVKVIAPVAVSTPLALWRFKDRSYSFGQLDAAIKIDGSALSSFTDDGEGNAVMRRDESAENASVLFRLGDNGPILNAEKTYSFWLKEIVESYYYMWKDLPDGSTEFDDWMFLGGQLPPGLSFKVKNIGAGITFENGNNNIWIQPADFNNNGMYKIKFFRDVTRTGGPCHRTEAYINGVYLDKRR